MIRNSRYDKTETEINNSWDSYQSTTKELNIPLAWLKLHSTEWCKTMCDELETE
jgi:hypothetical protein